MALPASKRRKVEHVSSDEEEDDNSFASFGASKEADGIVEDADGFSGFGSEEDDGVDDEDEAAQEYDLQESADGLSRQAQSLKGSKPGNDSKKSTAKSRAPTSSTPNNGVYTAGTFKSNMFKIQVDEMLEHIRPRHGKRDIAAEEVLRKLKTAIENIPARGPLPVDEAERQLLLSSKVSTPFPNPRPPKDVKYKLAYARPANINVVGSHALKTASRTKPVLEIDMVLVMPSSLFQEKDYQDFRYFYKRAYYLACVAAGLKETHGTDFRIHFRDLHDDPLKPIIVIRTLEEGDEEAKTKSKKWQINIVPCVGSDIFSSDRLLLDKTCVRSRIGEAPNSLEERPSGTPFYNASLRSDMLTMPYLQLLHSATKACAAFKDAGLLGSAWLRQRGFGSDISHGGFGNFEFTALVALLLQGGGPGGKSILNEGYSSYQLFKATLQLLAKRDLSKDPLLVEATEHSIKTSSTGGPIVWDSMRSHSLLYKMTPWSYKLLRQEAKTTLLMLDDQSSDTFEATFIVRADSLLYKYDYTFELDETTLGLQNRVTDHTLLTVHHKLYSVLHRGLGDRITLLDVISPPSESWDFGSARPTRALQRKLRLCIVINSDTVNRTIDHGPSAENRREAASFRKFWGEKAELRRFKDGSILESLVWSAKDSGPFVLEQIVRYLIRSHFNEDAEAKMTIMGNGFAKILPQANKSDAFKPIMEAYKQLENDIRALRDLPLSVRQIMPADSQLRYASIALPKSGQRVVPADVTLQFEGSVRWPDDLEAIQRTKIAFLLKLGEMLQDSNGTISKRVGLESEEHDIVNQAFLHVGYEAGSVFRLRIHHDREQTLLERMLKSKDVEPKVRDIAALGLAKYKRHFIKAPAHTQAIASLCSRHPAMSGTMRLAKKWFASHLLSNHVSDEIIELMVARMFVQPWPWQPPSSVQTGFLRTLLWISRWDWRAEPLIVDLSGTNELKQPDVQAVVTNFDAWRKLDPGLNRIVLFAASNVDRDGTTWTDGRPAKVVAGRMTALARAACAEVEAKQLSLEPGSLFSSPLGDFDCVIHLNPEFASKAKRKQAKGSVAFKNLQLELLHDSSLAGLDPIGDFLNDLESLYGSAILLFSGGHERPVIAGLWSPMTSSRAWKLHLAYSTIPTMQSKEDEVKAEINKEAILSQIARIGGDMVENITVNHS